MEPETLVVAKLKLIARSTSLRLIGPGIYNLSRNRLDPNPIACEAVAAPDAINAPTS